MKSTTIYTANLLLCLLFLTLTTHICNVDGAKELNLLCEQCRNTDVPEPACDNMMESTPLDKVLKCLHERASKRVKCKHLCEMMEI